MEELPMSVIQCAKALGISRGTAYSLIHEGRIPALRIGKKRLVVPRAALERMLQEARVLAQQNDNC